MTRNKWIIVIIATIIVLGGLIALSARPGLDVSKIDTNKIIPAGTVAGGTKVAIGDHIYGNPSGRALLVEYGDFQCPYCADLHPQLEPLLDYYKDSLTFVFRNFPLKAAHPNALAAATAAEAAGLQGSSDYWSMFNKLYDSQSGWVNADASTRTSIFVGYAKGLGLNVDKFTTDLNSTSISTKIDFDTALGTKVGVNATPSLYLQGKNISGPTGKAIQGDPTELENTIRSAIQASGLSVPDKTYAQAHSS
jgi:protein-disulfide isomerase